VKLSILICAIPERSYIAQQLINELEKQSEGKDVEILCLIDNRKRSIGAKRNALKSLVNGEYFAFCDDDDNISEDYISELLNAIEQKPDVVTFKQLAHINNEPFTVTFGIKNENEPAEKVGENYKDIKRKPFHVCAWKTSLVRNCFFSDTNYGEDSFFADFAQKEVLSEVFIDKILHYYFYSTEKTRAII